MLVDSNKRIGRPVGFKLSDDTKKKISGSLSGENHPLYGKERSEEVRAKISIKLVGIERSRETREKMGKSKRDKNKGLKIYKELLVMYTDSESRKFLEENKDKILNSNDFLPESSIRTDDVRYVDIDIENSIFASCNIDGSKKLNN